MRDAPSEPDRDRTTHDHVRRRLTDRLLRSAFPTLTAALVVAAIVSFALHRSTGQAGLGVWLGILGLVTAARLLLAYRLQRRLRAGQVAWAVPVYAAGAFLGGCVWAALLWFDSAADPLAARLLIATTLVGIPMASLSSNAAYQSVYFAFAAPILAALLAWAWSHGPVINVEYSLVAIAYIGLLAIMVRHHNHDLRRTLQRDVENERLLHEINAMNGELQRLAYQDPLTGLSNRRSFEASARRLLHRLGPDEQFALMLIDMDNFKSINDSLGHAAGDKALVTLARRIVENSRLVEMVAATQLNVARIGGDEFIVFYRLAPGSTVEPLAARILDVLVTPMSFERQRLRPSVSIGVALAPAHADDLRGLLRAADRAMYQAKGAGGGRFVVADYPAPPARAAAGKAGG
jgi:diguanylate cyclase (GGDEF)-like protein